ncbi:MAG TPA: SPFH domain-containing protein [Candidatus Limnocylindrales bacterium]|jgi:regulator of protease activity HflC (stomatin/prohibitin superfamily)|nr:SPFH domain-containing protein [Candidatus Limnocylindrales bacterium]
MNDSMINTNRERTVTVHNGWVMLPVLIALELGSLATFIYSVAVSNQNGGHPYWPLFVVGLLGMILAVVLMPGLFTLQPNEARVLVLFGKYKGTVRESGFHWGNPFYSNGARLGQHFESFKQKMQAVAEKRPVENRLPKSGGRNRISLRARNLNSEKLKVNDKRGNPVEIAAVIVWRVQDTAQAMFDVDDYETYVRIQSESAIRHVASAYAYDHGEENEITLRSGVDEVSLALQKELQARLDKAGVVVDEARLTHLAYAPEIAQAMLRRQQAEAVIAARQKIVHGAVSMVDMALKELAEKQVVSLDDERKASMVSNLMVVLCGEAEVHPVVNTGTLYT